MVKPMRVMVEIEEGFYGPVYRKLDTMPGVVSVTYQSELRQHQNGAVKAKGSRGQKHGGAQSASCLVLGALIHTPGLSREQLIPVLEGNGKSRNSLPDTLQKLKKAGEIRASGSGRDVTYKATTAGKKRFHTACEIQPAKE